MVPSARFVLLHGGIEHEVVIGNEGEVARVAGWGPEDQLHVVVQATVDCEALWRECALAPGDRVSAIVEVRMASVGMRGVLWEQALAVGSEAIDCTFDIPPGAAGGVLDLDLLLVLAEADGVARSPLAASLAGARLLTPTGSGGSAGLVASFVLEDSAFVLRHREESFSQSALPVLTESAASPWYFDIDLAGDASLPFRSAATLVINTDVDLSLRAMLLEPPMDAVLRTDLIVSLAAACFADEGMNEAELAACEPGTRGYEILGMLQRFVNMSEGGLEELRRDWKQDPGGVALRIRSRAWEAQ